MKPCPNRKKEITWLALGDLDANAARLLRSHLDTCPGCQFFWREISTLQRDLQAVAAPVDLEPSPGFHRNMANRVRNEQKPSHAIMRWIEAVRRFPEYGWPWPAGAVALAAIAVGLFLSHSPIEKNPGQSGNVLPNNPPLSFSSPAPTSLAHYRNAAAESLDGLDSLLARQAIASSSRESFRISSVHRSAQNQIVTP